MKDINAPRVHASDQDVNAQIELQSIHEERVLHVLTDDALFVYRNLRDVVNDANSFALTRVLGLDDPHIGFSGAFGLVEMGIKVGKLSRQHVGVGNDVKSIFSVLFLHFDYIGAESVFSSEFKRIRKVIDFLVIEQLIVDLGFDGLT